MGAKVYKLNPIEIYEEIERHLERCERRNERTGMSYRRDIEDFFNVIREGKELKWLNHNDVQVTLNDFEDFISKTIGKLNNATINKKITAVKGLLEYLHAKPNYENRIVKDISYFKLVERLPENAKEHGVLKVHEVFQIADLVRQEKDRGEEKFYLILLALDTCIRKTALLNLTWSQFEVVDDGVLIKGTDKGNKKYTKKISKKFFNEILTLKNEDQEKVFTLNSRTANRLIERGVKELGIPEERNVVFHSIRKAGATYQFRKTSDILQAQKVLGHKNLTTTQRYLEKEDYGLIGAVSGRENLDPDLYKKTDEDLLKEAISNMNPDFKALLNEEIMKLKGANE